MNEPLRDRAAAGHLSHGGIVHDIEQFILTGIAATFAIIRIVYLGRSAPQRAQVEEAPAPKPSPPAPLPVARVASLPERALRPRSQAIRFDDLNELLVRIRHQAQAQKRAELELLDAKMEVLQEAIDGGLSIEAELFARRVLAKLADRAELLRSRGQGQPSPQLDVSPMG